MPTSVHIPKALLEEVDRRARALGVSRNRLIVRALEREIASATAWSDGFFEILEAVEPADAEAIDEMLAAVAGQRRSKKPIAL